MTSPSSASPSSRTISSAARSGCSTKSPAAPPRARHDREFDELHARLNDLIAMNQAAMLRADSRAVGLGRRLTYEFAGGLLVLLVTGTAFSWALGWALARPLTELAERLRGLSQRHTQVRLGPQPLAELDAVAREFNQMAERLEQYEKLNVERLLYEKSKTEAIIESLEDGVVLIDSAGIVTHINEIAALIMDIEPADALGSPFDDLSSNSPHYLRVRDALRRLRRAAPDGPRTEVQSARARARSFLRAEADPAPSHRGHGARHPAHSAGRHLPARPGPRAHQPGRDAVARAAHAAHLARALGATAAARGGDARAQAA